MPVSRPRRGAPLLVAAAALAVVAAVAGPARADTASPSDSATGSSASPSGSSSGSSSEKVLRIGTTTAIDNPNLWAVNSTTEFLSATLQYDMLLKFGDADLQAAPSLSTGCTPSDGRRVWTCTLRSGLKWSDGQPLTSRDVAFTYTFAIDKQFPYFSGYFPAGTTFETPNDTTLVWRSKDPTNGPTVPAWVYIVPEHVWAKYASADVKTITSANVVPTVASGPYTMTEAVSGQRWTFTRNPNFWGPKPAYDSVVFQLFSNPEAMVQALKNGQIDMADNLDGSLLPALGKIPDVVVHKVTSDYWVNMAFNFGGQGPDSTPLPALKNLQVRKAIAMAINKQKIVDTVYPGAAEPGDTVIRPLSVFWHYSIPADQQYAYDPAAANAMLDQAGYARGSDGVRVDPKTGQPLVIRMPVSDDTAGSTAVGQLIAGFLKEIGITVKVQPVTAGKMYDIQQSGDFDAYIWYWSGDPDPNYQLSVFTTSECKDLSDGCFSDPAYDALFVKQQQTLDPTQRLPIVQEAQRYLYEKLPGIVVAYPNAIEAYRSDRVTGMTTVPGPNGYLLPQYNYDGILTAAPATQADAGGAAAEGTGGIPSWVWALVALVAVVVVVVALMRRRTRDEVPDTE